MLWRIVYAILQCISTFQVADFGLARLAGDASSTHVTTRVMGTFG